MWRPWMRAIVGDGINFDKDGYCKEPDAVLISG